jgi:hypothetical protein
MKKKKHPALIAVTAFCAIGIIGFVNSMGNNPAANLGDDHDHGNEEQSATASNEAAIKDDMLRNLNDRQPAPKIANNIPPPEEKAAPAPKPDNKPKINPIENRVSSGWFREDAGPTRNVKERGIFSPFVLGPPDRHAIETPPRTPDSPHRVWAFLRSRPAPSPNSATWSAKSKAS